MGIRFGIERLQPIWGQIYAIASMHWQETEMYRHGQPFAPDAYRYFQFNEMPALDGLSFFTMFTARDEGALVGYAGCYVTQSMHTQQWICTEDTYFLLPSHRKGRNALAFYKYIEERCRKAGVVEMGMTAKKVNSVGRILEYLGFEVSSMNYSKHLNQSEQKNAA